MASAKIDTVIKAYCSRCRGDRNCDVAGHYDQRGSEAGVYDWHTDWYLLVCRGCDNAFAQSVSTNSEDYYEGYDENGEIETIYHESVRIWPATSKRTLPDWFQHGAIESDIKETLHLEATLTELYGALNHELKALAAIGLRTSFDIAAEVLGVDPNLRFEQKIEDMVERNLIKESEREHIAILVDAGSASAHRGWLPTANELDSLMEVLENFIYDAFVVPGRKQRAAKALAKVKARVPPRETKNYRKKKPKQTQPAS